MSALSPTNTMTQQNRNKPFQPPTNQRPKSLFIMKRLVLTTSLLFLLLATYAATLVVNDGAANSAASTVSIEATSPPVSLFECPSWNPVLGCFGGSFNEKPGLISLPEL